MNRRATIVFAATWPVLGRIPDQPGAGSHRFATERSEPTRAYIHRKVQDAKEGMV